MVGQREADQEIVSLTNRLAELKSTLREIEEMEPILAGFFTEEHHYLNQEPLKEQMKTPQLKAAS